MLKAGSRCPAERALRLLGEVLKSARIFHRQVSKNLAVQFDPSLLQAVDELRVAEAILLGVGGDADDPQRAELALALLASRVRELQSALDGFLRRPIQFRFCQEITAGAV